MDVQLNANMTNRPIGIASKLKRYGASVANHSNYNRRGMITSLAEDHHNLKIEEKPETPENPLEENPEETEEPTTRIEWESLQCPKCARKAGDTQVLLDHLVESHGKPEDKLWYKEFNTVGLELNKLFEKAVAKQSENSVIKRKFDNTNDTIVCPTESPLAPYMMMRHLQIYFKEMPSSLSDGISLKVKNGDQDSVVIFSFHKVDRARRRIKRAMAKKVLADKLKQLERRCQMAFVEVSDIVLKKTKTPEELKALAQAFDLPANCSSDEIMKKVEEMKAKHEEANLFCSNVYTKIVKPDGQLMSKEEKRLISSLTNDMVMPVAGKRKTTFKNPSELAPTKKRQKTSSPQ